MWRWSWWIPMAVVIGFFVKFAFFHKGLIAEYSNTNIFLLVLCLVCIPKMLFSLLSLIPKVGTYAGIAVAAGMVYMILWGITYGFGEFQVRRITYESPDVPEAFDGYRIAQFSDAHSGVFTGPYKHLLKESIDSINALNADLICFVGDIENFSPSELQEHKKEYSRLHAKDGVMSIMGNHDYSAYVKVSDRERYNMVQETRQLQRDFGWDLLENEHRVITREKDGCQDSIVIVGEENWGKPPFPQYGNLKKATEGLCIDKDFTVLLSHDPTAWTRHVMPFMHPEITLSGHTHGTQLSLFGWSPASMAYDQWGGEYTQQYKEKNMLLSVSTGFGGNFPFRFNMPREVVLITLKKSK